jgi:hypothetical protein
VYTIAFLSVMVLFGIGNVFLKVKRKNLPRPEKTGWPALLFAFAAVVVAIIGKSLLNPHYMAVFLEYFIPSVLVVAIMLNQINDQEFVFFTRDDDLAVLNNAMLYIRQNENTCELKIVTIVQSSERVRKDFLCDVDVPDRKYPDIKIEFIQLEGEFTPRMVRKLSKEWNIPINFMFIGSPGDHFPYRIEKLGGVRLMI